MKQWITIFSAVLVAGLILGVGFFWERTRIENWERAADWWCHGIAAVRSRSNIPATRDSEKYVRESIADTQKMIAGRPWFAPRYVPIERLVEALEWRDQDLQKIDWKKMDAWEAAIEAARARLKRAEAKGFPTTDAALEEIETAQKYSEKLTREMPSNADPEKLKKLTREIAEALTGSSP